MKFSAIFNPTSSYKELKARLTPHLFCVVDRCLYLLWGHICHYSTRRLFPMTYSSQAFFSEYTFLLYLMSDPPQWQKSEKWSAFLFTKAVFYFYFSLTDVHQGWPSYEATNKQVDCHDWESTSSSQTNEIQTWTTMSDTSMWKTEHLFLK